jgi:hypothetical protein
MNHLLRSSHARLLLALSSLVSLAIVIEAGHRW